MIDLDDLSDRLQTSSLRYVRLYQAECEFLAELIQAYIRSRGRKEIASQKAVAVAQRVIWLEEFRGLKTEAAIADAEQRFGLKRSRVTDILKEQRPKLDSFRSYVSSDAYRQDYALIEEDRAFGDVEVDTRQPYARLLEEVTEFARLEKMDEAELAKLEKMDEAMKAELAAAELVDIR
jgi:hypothetical protein